MRAAVATTLLIAAAAGVVDGRGVSIPSPSFLSVGEKLQPGAVAVTFAHVEDEWRAQAGFFAECTGNGDNAVDCAKAQQAFMQSCSKVVTAIVQGSGGKSAEVEEYMGDVCSEQVLKDWKRDDCHILTSTVLGTMTANTFFNRQRLDSAGMCQKYWSTFSVAEKERAEKDRVEHEAREKKDAEERAEAEKKEIAERAEAEKKAAEERAKAQQKAEEAAKKAEEERREAEKKAAEEAAVEEKRRLKVAEEAAAMEAKQKAEAAKQKAVEAKKQAEEAAARLADKRAEAEHQAEDAKKTAEEAKAAASATEQYKAEANSKTSTPQKHSTAVTVAITNATAVAPKQAAQETGAEVVES